MRGCVVMRECAVVTERVDMTWVKVPSVPAALAAARSASCMSHAT